MSSRFSNNDLPNKRFAGFRVNAMHASAGGAGQRFIAFVVGFVGSISGPRESTLDAEPRVRAVVKEGRMGDPSVRRSAARAAVPAL